MNTPANPRFRLAILAFAILLGLQCVWLLLPELWRTGTDRLPTDPSSAAAAARYRSAAAWAASFGVIRGDLWAKSAFSYADLLWGDSGGADLPQALAHARASLGHALKDAPHQSGAWLLLAGLASRYPSPSSNVTAPLKMSYYTGPSEQDLVPLRLRIAAHSSDLTDFEIRQFITRDLRLLLASRRQSAIVAAYDGASPAGKRFIEEAVGDIDPSAVKLLQAGAQSAPN